MEREFLAKCIADGLTLREIGELTGKHLSTVGYWMKRRGLQPSYAAKYAPKGRAITKERIEKLVDEGASLNELAEALDLSVSGTRYWLKKYGLRTLGVGRRRRKLKAAERAGKNRAKSDCQHHGLTDFVLDSRGHWRCARCRAENVSNWRRRAKLRLIETAGGSCVICGYDNYPGALHFHHLEPTQKRFAISRQGVTRSFAELMAEASKCVLLCANCHAEVEGGYRGLRN